MHVARAVAGIDPNGASTLPYYMAVCSCGWRWGVDSFGSRTRIIAQDRADEHWLREHAGIG